MHLLISLVLIVTLLGIYVLYFKLAAALVRARISWAHAFVFAGLMLVLGIAVNVLPLTEASGVPAFVAPVLGVVLSVLLGGWFFSTRAVDAGGQTLGWLGASKLSALAIALLVATGILLILLAKFMAGPPAQSVMG
jgi:hypothetical protein